MFYVLGFDSNYTITQYLDWLNMDDCEFQFDLTTPWINDENFEVVVSLEESQNGKLSDYFSCGSLTIVSDKFRAILSQANANLEFVPTSIMCGEEDEFQYFALHVMNVLDVFDKQKADFWGEKFGMFAGISNLVVLEDKVADCDIFILYNSFNPIVLISEKLKLSIESNGIKGIAFTPINEYKEDVRGL